MNPEQFSRLDQILEDASSDIELGHIADHLGLITGMESRVVTRPEIWSFAGKMIEGDLDECLKEIEGCPW